MSFSILVLLSFSLAAYESLEGLRLSTSPYGVGTGIIR